MSEFFYALNHDEQMELNAGTAVCVRINETIPIPPERNGCKYDVASAKDIANAYASSSNRYTYGAR